MHTENISEVSPMKYDFTSIIDRRGRDAISVDGMGSGGAAPELPKEGFDSIPMWVADMSFPTCPAIPAAMIERAKHPLFGYFSPMEEYYNAIIGWHKERKGADYISPAHIGYENGVLGGVVSAMNILCSKGDSVLVHSPTYVGFTHCLENNGYNIVHSPLKPDADGIWRMDLADMEEKLITNRIHTMILCSPHNPTGRVWERWELEAVAELCRKHDVYVISDEIWSDITRPEAVHIPTQSVSEDMRSRTIALYAPSKTFSLAGLVGSYHIICSKRLKDRMDKEAYLSHYNSMNVMSMHALIAAYSEDGRQWADEMNAVITENIDLACEFISAHFEGVTLSRPQGTYMLFIDCTDYCARTGRSIEELLRAGWDVGVGWQDGRAFHGPCHIRINLALPKARLEDALHRMKEYVFI